MMWASSKTLKVIFIAGWIGLNLLPARAQAEFYSDPNTIQNNIGVDSVSGREEKANDAMDQSHAGQGAATGAGIALMAAAAAAFAALNIPLGVTLTTMAGMEFAQAGADYNVGGLNSAQENLLRANANGGQANQTTFDPNAIADSLHNNPSIPAGLAAAGISDPDAFLKDVTSGKLTSAESVLDEMGQTGNFTAEQVAQMGDFSKVDMAQITGEEGNAAAAVLGMDDSSQTVAASSARGLASSPNGAGIHGAAGANGNAENKSSGAHQGIASGKAGALAALGTDGEAAGSFQGLQFGANGTVAGAAPAAALEGMDRMQLKDMGILKPHGKRTIFQIAGRNYKSFQSWRKSKKVAQN